MVRRERATSAPVATPVATPAAEAVAADTALPAESVEPAQPVVASLDETPEQVADLEDTSSIAAVVDPMLWDPVPVTLPTYVTKPAARRRTVRTIDLDATGVWTSGNTVGDSQIAREAEQADKAARSRKADDDQRAVGS